MSPQRLLWAPCLSGCHQSPLNEDFQPQRSLVEVLLGTTRSLVEVFFDPQRSLVKVLFVPQRSLLKVLFDPPRLLLEMLFGPPKSLIAGAREKSAGPGAAPHPLKVPIPKNPLSNLGAPGDHRPRLAPGRLCWTAARVNFRTNGLRSGGGVTHGHCSVAVRVTGVTSHAAPPLWRPARAATSGAPGPRGCRGVMGPISALLPTAGDPVYTERLPGTADAVGALRAACLLSRPVFTCCETASRATWQRVCGEASPPGRYRL